MKRILLILFFLPMLSLAVSASEKIDGIYYNLDANAKTATVVFHVRYLYSGEVVIPSTVTHEGVDYTVTRIESDAFKRSTDLTSVTIPRSVTSIGSGIFQECSSLTSINIEEGNPVFDSRENCNAIIETASNTLIVGCKGSTIPNGVTSIGKNAFLGCTALTSFNIPNHVVTIGESAFEGCSGLTSINIPNSVTSIGNEAFSGCSNLTKVELNNNDIVSKRYNTSTGSSIITIFGGQVKEYYLGEDVTSIGDGAFYGCSNLTTVQMTDNVTSIGEYAFSGCEKLASVNISNKVTSIGDFAFRNCIKLTSITIPASLTNLEPKTFYNCRLTKVEIHSNAIVSKDESYTSLGSYFGPLVEEYILGEEVTKIGNYAFSGSAITSIIIPNNVTSIGKSAFSGSALTSIYIPVKVTSIGDNAFYNCIGLTSVQVESGNTVYDSRENCNALIETASNTLLLGCKNTILPNTVTNIGDNAFYCCEGLTSISIPNSVKNIGDNAFQGCTGLTTVNLSNSITKIGKNAFLACKGLTSVIIPNSVTIIDEEAFFACDKLKSITIPKSVTNIGYRAFNSCSGLTSIQVESGNTVYDSRDNCNAIIKTADNTILFGCQNTTIPNSVTGIGELAFSGCTCPTPFTIPNNITSIGRSAFMNCTNLTAISIPSSVTSIEDHTFADCSKLTSIIIPSSVTKIGEGAFLHCSSLTDMYYYAEQMPETGNDIFDVSNYRATLHVPADLVDAFSNAEQWNNFKIIEDDYRPFIEDDKVWKVGSTTGITDGIVKMVDRYYFDGDIIIDGKTCKQMMRQRYISSKYPDYDNLSQSPSLSIVGAWYEEDKKVYFYDEDKQSMVLMYDFSIGDNESLQLFDDYPPFMIGPKQTGGIKGFKGVYRDIMIDQNIKSTTWLESVGGIDGPTRNAYPESADPVPEFLMSCTVGDEVIFLNDEYEDGASPVPMGAKKHRFDFTHTVKTKPKAPIKRVKSDACIGSSEREVARPKVKAPRKNKADETVSPEMQSLYGEYNNLQLDINLDPLDEAYIVRITNESGNVVYEKAINAGSIVALNIDISAYAKGRYTVTMENSHETFYGEYDTQTTGIKEVNSNVTRTVQYYSIDGKRIATPQRGLNIIRTSDGKTKKVVVK